MSDLVNVGQSIEGASIAGQSRKPLFTTGMTKRNGIVCYHFVAKFDVRAHVKSPLSADAKRLDPEASSSLDDEIICAKANIYTLSKHRPDQKVARGSSTHQTNHWTLPKQSTVRIEFSHQELVNAQSKRLREAKRRLPSDL